MDTPDHAPDKRTMLPDGGDPANVIPIKALPDDDDALEIAQIPDLGAGLAAPTADDTGSVEPPEEELRDPPGVEPPQFAIPDEPHAPSGYDDQPAPGTPSVFNPQPFAKPEPPRSPGSPLPPPPPHERSTRLTVPGEVQGEIRDLPLLQQDGLGVPPLDDNLTLHEIAAETSLASQRIASPPDFAEAADGARALPDAHEDPLSPAMPHAGSAGETLSTAEEEESRLGNIPFGEIDAAAAEAQSLTAAGQEGSEIASVLKEILDEVKAIHDTLKGHSQGGTATNGLETDGAGKPLGPDQRKEYDPKAARRQEMLGALSRGLMAMVR